MTPAIPGVPPARPPRRAAAGPAWAACAVTLACSGSPGGATPVLEAQTSGTAALLQAVSAVDERVAWASGHDATYAVTVDGGATWRAARVPGPDTLQFRDVHGVDDRTAYLLAAGPGDMSRIYKTTDGGAHWALQWTNDHPDGFYDCFDFWDAESGLVFGDAVDGRLSILETSDGGEHWAPLPAGRVPAARGSEGGFAASGTCLATHGASSGWIATGAGDTARVLRTSDRGASWAAAEVPVTSGTGSSGLASLIVFDALHLLALGGDIADPDRRTDNVAVSRDGGATWSLAGRPVFPGAVYGGSAVPGVEGAAVAAGPRGLDYTADGGRTWISLDTLSHWAVGFGGPTSGWAVGPGGRITKIRFPS